MNVVMTASGQLIEIQATGEESPFDRTTFNDLLSLAENGIEEIVNIQKAAFLAGDK